MSPYLEVDDSGSNEDPDALQQVPHHVHKGSSYAGVAVGGYGGATGAVANPLIAPGARAVAVRGARLVQKVGHAAERSSSTATTGSCKRNGFCQTGLCLGRPFSPELLSPPGWGSQAEIFPQPCLTRILLVEEVLRWRWTLSTCEEHALPLSSGPLVYLCRNKANTTILLNLETPTTHRSVPPHQPGQEKEDCPSSLPGSVPSQLCV